MESLTDRIDETISDGLDWLNDNWSGFFDALRLVMEGLYNGIEAGLTHGDAHAQDGGSRADPGV